MSMWYNAHFTSRIPLSNQNLFSAGDPVCIEDQPWPKIKNGSIATIPCTDPGRVGIKERQCNVNQWGTPTDLCVKAIVNQLTSAAGVSKMHIVRLVEKVWMVFFVVYHCFLRLHLGFWKRSWGYTRRCKCYLRQSKEQHCNWKHIRWH